MKKHLLTLISAVLIVKSVELPGCIEGELQLQQILVNESNVNSLMYCQNNTWMGVCQVLLTPSLAQVACRQLGYSDQEPNYGKYCDDRNQSAIRIRRRNCAGTENRLQECVDRNPITSCILSCNRIWLECKPDCMDGEVRLINGSANGTGRVEVCQNGHWGTVCSRSQDGVAKVACSKLGFAAGVTTRGTFSPGIVPISNCSIQNGGNLSCTQITDASCDHSMDLGVMCLTSEQYMEVLGQCPSPTAQNETIPETAPTILNIVLGVVMSIVTVLLLSTVTALVVTCVKKANKIDKSVNTYVTTTDQLAANTSDNPAYKVTKQNNDAEQYYETFI